MNKYLRLSFPVLALFASSCSSVYMPNVPNTPMLSKQGEFSGGGHISLKGNASINGAYAVSDHIGVIFSGSTMNSERRTKDFGHKLIEIGGGYFDTFGPDNNRIIEIYGGVGKGWSDITFRDYKDDVLISNEVQEVDYRKSFLQVNYSSKKKNNLRLFGTDFPINYGTALRISHVKMDRFFLNGVVQPKEDNIFFEPIFFTRMGLSKNIQLQYTTSSNIGLKSRKYMSAGNSIFTLGIVVNVGGK
ncbi:hypothetical protein EZ449_21720 [Pedobacter frigidisoli]|uniref:Outer membrane protein beta-barrel domain-containing protein n=1 Tax=Pedobacter frigidisoli TaxID=2530455 RepID=A0A4R0NCX6_9SPHI|nr:hypothetical protein [Pedobacter frigidisoli]TCC98098.1 hypothetical protein EZ449_21720 [Pedobacter frigidisoli]